MPSRPNAPSSTRGTTVVAVRRPDPRVWREALALAGGDHRRLEVHDDGTVVVRNAAVR